MIISMILTRIDIYIEKNYNDEKKFQNGPNYESVQFLCFFNELEILM